MANSIFDTVDLGSLPAPQVVDTPEFETIYQELLAQFRTFEPRYTFTTEADPVVKVLEAWAAREVLLRARINEAAKANLLAFAEDSDLDHLGAIHGVARLIVQAENLNVSPIIPEILEDDEAFRFRIQQRILGYVNGAAFYRYWALTASPDVRDAKVFSPDHPNGYNMGGRVNVAILARTGDLIPSEDLLDEVRLVLARDNVKQLGDLLLVEAATPLYVNVSATIKLLPSTPKATFDGLEALLRDRFEDVQALGYDLTKSWISATLQQPGVHSVILTAPSTETIVAPNQFPILNTVTLTFAGYSDGEPLAVAAMEEARTMRTINETYRNYAISVKRTKDQIKGDLATAPIAGVLRPTLQQFAGFLGIQNLKNDQDAYYSADDLAFLIWRKLSASYF